MCVCVRVFETIFVETFGKKIRRFFDSIIIINNRCEGDIYFIFYNLLFFFSRF